MCQRQVGLTEGTGHLPWQNVLAPECCWVPYPWGTAPALQAACVGLSPENGIWNSCPGIQHVQQSEGLSVLLNSIYRNQSKRSLVFITLQVGFMKVKVYSRLLFFFSQLSLS